MMTMDELKTAVNALKAIDQVREMVRERDKIKRTARRVAIAAGVIAAVGAGAYAIYRFVIKRNKAEALEDEVCEDKACICSHDEKAAECVCSETHHEHEDQDAACDAAAEAACDEAGEAAKEN